MLSYDVNNIPIIINGIRTAHAAVDKACDMLGIKLIKVPLESPGMQVSVAAVRRNIGPNTILLYASAPSFPHGTIDPIEQLAQLAYSHEIGLHVDCCLGGFVLPFAKASGLGVPSKCDGYYTY